MTVGLPILKHKLGSSVTAVSDEIALGGSGFPSNSSENLYFVDFQCPIADRHANGISNLGFKTHPDAKVTIGEELYTLNGGHLERPPKLAPRASIDNSLDRRPSSRRESNRSLQYRGSCTERDTDTPPSSSTSQSRITSTNGCPATHLVNQFRHSPVNGQEGFRPLATRSNFLSGQQIAVRFPQTYPPPPVSNRGESDDLVAMGTATNWQQSSPMGQIAIRSCRQNLTSCQGTNQTSRKQRQNTNQALSGRKDLEPRYTDPFIGATNIFQQRIAELASLESDTIRKERSVKVKKKYKSERDI